MLKIRSHDCACWILCTPRTGSTYLCDLLNSSNLFVPEFREWFGQKLGIYNQPEDLERRPCFYNKVLHVQFNRIFNHHGRMIDDPIFDVCQTENPTAENRIKLETILKPKYVVLKRDIFQILVSYYVATLASASSGESFFVIRDHEKQKRFLQRQVGMDEKLLRRIYAVVKTYDEKWNLFLSGVDHLQVNYDLLSENPREVVSNIFDFIGAEKRFLPDNFHMNEISRKAAMARPDIEELSRWARSVIEHE